MSAEDLVQGTLTKFFESPNGLGWKESKGTLPVYLGKILENRFFDHVRRDKKLVRPDPDSDSDVPPKSRIRQPTIIDDIALDAFRNRLLGLIKDREDESELTDFIEAASLTNGEGKVNQQIADLLGTDTDHVVSCRLRLLRVTGVKKLREEFRDGREGNISSDKSDQPVIG